MQETIGHAFVGRFKCKVTNQSMFRNHQIYLDMIILFTRHEGA